MVNNSKEFLKVKSPTILSVAGVLGMTASTVMAVKATPKAIDILSKKEEEKGSELTGEEKVKAAWKLYVPSLAIGTMSAAFIFTSTGIYSKRMAKLSNEYTTLAAHAEVTRMALRGYRDKVIEVVGEEKEAEIRQEVAKNDKPYIVTSKTTNKQVAFLCGECLCLEPMTKSYFRSDMNSILDVMNKINNDINTGQPIAGFNDWLYELGLDPCEFGNSMGWNLTNLMKLDFYAEVAPNGEPCLVIDYISKPQSDYDKL